MAVETIGEAHSYGWRIRARCAHGRRDGMKSIRECTYSAELDMETLVWTRGRAFPLAWLQERLRCPTCGSRRVTIAYILPSEQQTAANRNSL
jgi:hypothetical protein